MSDIKYDSEFPYVVGHDGSEDVIARFSSEEDAIYLARGYKGMWVIDTTPKPKISEDARFVHWFVDGGNFIATREGFNPLKPWELEGSYYTEEQLLEQIGDAEVTVLVRKEES